MSTGWDLIPIKFIIKVIKQINKMQNVDLHENAKMDGYFRTVSDLHSSSASLPRSLHSKRFGTNEHSKLSDAAGCA